MRRAPLVLVAAFAAPAHAGFDMTFQSDPYPGMRRETWVDAAIPARIRLMRIDLTSSEIALYATAENDRGSTTTDYAARKGAQLAINGDAFAVNGYVPRGLAVGDSNPWSNTSDDTASAVLHVRRYGERTYAGIVVPESVVGTADLPAGTEGVLSGRPLLVRQSQVETTFDCNDQVTLACVRAPRTAVAVSPNGNVMWLAVVDGWQSGSLGLTASELAAFLRDRGAGMAMALDGGSSSTLVLDGSVISSPSDGVERTVANHLAVKYGSLPKGELYGLVCKDTVINCNNEPARKIAGATVTLDDGRQQVTDTTGSYDFLNVTARLACVTVKKAGYVTKTQCKQVVPQQINYNSVALYLGQDPPDAGVGLEDAGIGVDASGARDAQTGDGGNGFEGGGGGCCDSGTGRSGPNGALLVLVAWLLTRRRGTTN